ncbi:hypothetical protein M3Y97_00903600 [Aphelenchoides bicaudatus]|nr:hypothetical protein M3Y97_00903600 [Aphelenchoides bicaudatus]
MRSKLLFLLLFALPFVVFGYTPEFCTRTQECIHKIRKLTAQTNRFWFGDNWRLSCGGFAASRLRELQSAASKVSQ